MKTIDKKTMIIAAVTLTVGMLVGLLIPGFKKSNMPHEHELVKAEISGETVWTCSMHPHIRLTEPGDCPVCGMDLIPLQSDVNAEMAPDAVVMSPTAMKLAEVSTMVVKKEVPVKQIHLNGKIQMDERLLYAQSSHIAGRIEKLKVNFTGEFITKGSIMAYVYSPELVAAQEELLEANKTADLHPQLLKSAKDKLKNWKLSDSQINKIIHSGVVQEEFPILSNASGFVSSKLVSSGDYIQKGQIIYQIADLSKVWTLFEVYETDLVWVKKGSKLNFTIAAFPGETFTGVVSYLDPVVDAQTRVAKARIELRNTDGRLKPGMFATGVLDAKPDRNSNAIVIPASAVMWTGKRSVVYVKSGDEKRVEFSMREIELGPSLGDSYIVTGGLDEGQEIAVNGTFSIDAAAQLAGKPSMMSPSGGQMQMEHNHGAGTSQDEKAVQSVKVYPVKVQPVEAVTKHDALMPVYTAYLAWKKELAADRFQQAQQVAGQMKSAVDNVRADVLPDNVRKLWADNQIKLVKSLQHVEHHSDIQQLRKSFQSVSDVMIVLAEKLRVYDKTLYVQHCPMANDNKGADWLSTEKEIINPYFGKSMLTCGEIIKEISGSKN